MLHMTQLCSRSGREHPGRQSWTVLQQVCSSELFLMTGSAMHIQQRRLSNSDQALYIDLCTFGSLSFLASDA